MSTISSSAQNFHGSTHSANSACNSKSVPRSAVDSPRFNTFAGATALASGNPGFGARSSGRFSLGEFLAG